MLNLCFCSIIWALSTDYQIFPPYSIYQLILSTPHFQIQFFFTKVSASVDLLFVTCIQLRRDSSHFLQKILELQILITFLFLTVSEVHKGFALQKVMIWGHDNAWHRKAKQILGK